MSLHLDARQRAMLKEMGVTVWLPGTEFAVASPAPQPAPGTVRRPPVVPAVAAQVPALREPALASGDPPVRETQPMAPALAQDWPSLVAQVGACAACPQHTGRNRCVLRADIQPPKADWLVVVDPPDEEQERQQSPVTGDAAVLLDNMLKAVGVARNGSGTQGAYVTPVTKCRVPHAILPTAEDLQQCLAHLRMEIALVQPRIVLLMGRFAQQLVLLPGAVAAPLALDPLRGSVHRVAGLPAIVTYPPAILLRNSAAKAKAWADLCLAMDTLDDVNRAGDGSLPTMPLLQSGSSGP